MKITHKPNYRLMRQKAYPPIGDQLDAVYKLTEALQGVIELPPEVLAWLEDIKAVKASYPK